MKALLSYCKKFNRIYCYGAGYYGIIVYSYLHVLNIKVDGYLVTKKTNNKSSLGIPIYDCNDIFGNKNETGIIISVGNKYCDEVVNTLLRNGYNDYFVFSKEELLRIERIALCNNISLSPNICVLLYHRVCKLDVDIWNLAISPNVFEQHIVYLKKNFNLLRFEEDWGIVKEPSVIITIDDGYADIWENALPILEKYDVPATVFVTTGNIDKKEEFWWDKLEQIFFKNDNLPNSLELDGMFYPLMSMKEKKQACYFMHGWLKQMPGDVRNEIINDLSKRHNAKIVSRNTHRSLSTKELELLSKSPCITIGGHTVNHPSLANERLAIQEYEINESKHIIERIIGKRIDVFSYPFGGECDYTEESKDLVMKAGYKKIATTSYGLINQETSLLDIPRNSISADLDIMGLKKELVMIWSKFDN